MQPLDFTPLRDLTARVVLFPVRHHSPAAARLVRELILRAEPDPERRPRVIIG